MQRGTGSRAASFYRIGGNTSNAAQLSRPERGQQLLRFLPAAQEGNQLRQLKLHPEPTRDNGTSINGNCGASEASGAGSQLQAEGQEDGPLLQGQLPPGAARGRGYPWANPGGRNRARDSGDFLSLYSNTSTLVQDREGRGMAKRKKKRARRPLTDQQKLAVKLLFETGEVGKTAAAVGVCRQTIWRWRNTKQFQKEYARYRDKWLSAFRRECRQKWLHSTEHKKELAARRKLKALEKKLSEAGNRGDMAGYRKACASYNSCYYAAYGRALKAFDTNFNHDNYSRPKKRREPRRCIVEIID